MSIVNSLLKVFLGDKSGKDLKKITPLVDDINNHFVKMSSLSNDQLRNKTIEFKKSISDQTSDINQSIGELNIKISDESSNTEKELLFKEVESLENDLILKKAEILDELLPEAFAVIKETAKRFFENEEIEVTTSDFDKEIAAKKSYTKIKK
jgi:preprotein translocase subunit SecA